MIRKILYFFVIIFYSIILINAVVFNISDQKEIIFKTSIIHKKAYDNFIYKQDKKGIDSWDSYDINYKFYGDCEDFAFSMKKEIGKGSVYLVSLRNNKKGIPFNHAVFIYQGIIWEVNGKHYTIKEYKALGNKILFELGEMSQEKK